MYSEIALSPFALREAQHRVSTSVTHSYPTQGVDGSHGIDDGS